MEGNKRGEIVSLWLNKWEKTYLLELIKFARDINFDETYFSDGMTEDEIVGSVIKLERKIEECK